MHHCGHDSIPWDLSAMMLAEKLRQDHGEELARWVCVWVGGWVVNGCECVCVCVCVCVRV